MDLRHIDELIEKHSAGWQPLEKHSRGWHPLKGNFRIGGNPFRKPLSFLSRYTPLGAFGAYELPFKHGSPNSLAESLAGALGINTPAARGAETDAQNRARAEAEAAVKQAKFEASKRAGLEKLMLKRRRGFGASMIVQPTLGSTMTLGS